MTYEFRCRECASVFDVIKRVSEMDTLETCPDCKGVSERIFIPRRIHLSGTAVEDAVYNPGLGCIVKNKQHLKQICKDRNLIEVGNEAPEKIHHHYDKARDEKREALWAEADKGWVGEA